MRRGRSSPALLLAALLLLAAVCAAAVPAVAAAHAALESSVPAAGAELASSPDRVVLTFGETPDPSLSLIEIVDANGAPVPGASPVRPVPGDEAQLQVMLAQRLPRGVYTVN